MDHETAEEIESFFEEMEIAEELVREGDVRTIFAKDIRVGDIISIADEDYYVDMVRHMLTRKSPKKEFASLGLRPMDLSAESDLLSIAVRSDKLIKVRRIQ